MVAAVVFTATWGWMENGLKQWYLEAHPPEMVVTGYLEQPAQLEAIRYYQQGVIPEQEVLDLPAGPFELSWPLSYGKVFELMTLELLQTPNELYISEVNVVGSNGRISWSSDSLNDITWFPYAGGLLESGNIQENGYRFKIRHENQRVIFRNRFKEAVTKHVFRMNPFRTIGLTALLAVLVVVLVPIRRLSVLPSHQLFLFLGFLGMLAFPTFHEDNQHPLENRLPAAFPDVANTHIWDLPGKIDPWYKDHFPERHNLSRADNWIKYDLFRVSPRPDLVLIGSEGWLYSSQPAITVQYTGAVPFSQEELERIRENFEIRRDWLRIRGADYYVVIPPMKHEIYPEFLPPRIRPISDTSRLDQVMRYLKEHSDIPIIDLKSVLLARKPNNHLYYKTDTHWNQVGAWYGYAALIEVLRAQYPELDAPTPLNQFRIDTLSGNGGDLLSMMNMVGKFERTAYILSPNVERVAEPRQSASAQALGDIEIRPTLYFTTQDTTKPDFFMIRDSYAEYLYHNLAEHFHHSTFYWTRDFPVNTIGAERPDIVLHESLGSFIDYFLQPNPDTVVNEVMQYRTSQRTSEPTQN
ncbi:MAG: hypothetical protein F6K11_01850 [Leptolyngbya sp. SIO3F4]|nr:hypothetical protein [Leptolyngbya sp. SIO3F4]